MSVNARRWIRPTWFAVLLTVAGITAFCYLGFWQLQRADDKAALLDAFSSTAATATMSLADARRTTAAAIHPRVRVRGTFVSGRGYVLDDQIRDGRQGMMVYGVFEPAEGSVPVLVNRGFLARDMQAQRASIPPVEAGEVEISGVYAPAPGTGLRMGGNALPNQREWPKLTIYIDPGEIGADLGRPIDDRVILLDAQAGSVFKREWTPQILPPERHHGYALQWFTFALAALVIFIVLHWRREQPGSR